MATGLELYMDKLGINVQERGLSSDAVANLLLANAKAKENLKEIFPLPYSFNINLKHADREYIASEIAYVYNQLTTPNYYIYGDWVLNNKMSNGQKLTRFIANQMLPPISNAQLAKYSNKLYHAIPRRGEYSFTDILRSFYDTYNDITYTVKFSCEVEDMLEASTNCGWSSCFGPDGMCHFMPFMLILDKCSFICLIYNDKGSKIGRMWMHMDEKGMRFVAGRVYGKGQLSRDLLNVIYRKAVSLMGYDSSTQDNWLVKNWKHRSKHFPGVYIDAPSFTFAAKESFKGRGNSMKMGTDTLVCLDCGQPTPIPWARRGYYSNYAADSMLKCDACKAKTFRCVSCGKVHPAGSGAYVNGRWNIYCDNCLGYYTSQKSILACRHCGGYNDNYRHTCGHCHRDLR